MKKRLSIAASAALVLVMTGCGDDGISGVDGIDGVDLTNAIELDFVEVSAPITDAEKMAIRTSTSVTYKNGSTDTIGFTPLISASTLDNGETFGLLKDYLDAPITFEDGNPFICDGANGNARGSGLDHSSIIQKDGRLFMVGQFECGVGAMYGMELEQATDGALNVKKDSLEYISQKEGFGGWIHCAGMTTPWESHLGSEEYEPDARAIESDLDLATMLTGSNKSYDEVTKYYWKDENNANASKNNNPYYYGYIPEVKVDGSATAASYAYAKHFSMGRAAWEMAYVMPDAKTAYLTDDGTNVGLYMYIADTAQDLSSGSLYAAKWIQTSDVDAGAADIMWIELGHASDAEIQTIVEGEPKFSDIFNVETPTAEFTCATAGFSAINTAKGLECLQVKPGQEKAAAFLETRRYSAMLGATTEFRKEEGITFDAANGTLFVAMSQVRKGMEDGSSSDNGGHNDIRLSSNACGAVYAMDVLGANEVAYDSKQKAINSAYVVENMYGIISGSETNYPIGSIYEAYECSVNGIANPDNVAFIDGKNTLIIGEDTGDHPNDFVWSYDLTTKKLTRIVTTPYGSETTSPYWYDINGFGYLSLVTQHPFGETSSGDVDFNLEALATDAQKQSSVGVVGPFKSW